MWCVRLSDSQRDALWALVGDQTQRGPALTAALEALDLARWDDLPDATLPWDRVADLAEQQGIGEADVVWDLTGRVLDESAKKRVVRRLPRAKRARPKAA
jgi:hypothetical protein